MTSHNFQTLRGAVIAGSRAKTWAAAVEEWEVVGLEEESAATGMCVCGNTGLRYLYTIRNPKAGQELSRSGASASSTSRLPS